MRTKEKTYGCVALVLAAGRGRRFGSDKRVAVLPSGERMLTQTLNRALAVFPQVWVVLRVEDDPVALGIDDRVTVVRAGRADEGMGRSLATGVAALEGTGFEAVAVMLGDMPWVEVRTLEQSRDLAERERIVVPTFDGTRGHPVVFGKQFWKVLAGLDGDQGGKRLIELNREACLVFETGDPGVLLDVDAPIAD